MSDIDGKKVFDEDARQYDLSRPSYPDELVRDVLAYSCISGDSRILEIGSGTGQATVPFARHGNPMLCLEPGPTMSLIAKEKLSSYPRVRVETLSLEDWPLEPNAFDLAISGTAFHWIPPDISFPKVASALTNEGALALFWNKHPGPYSLPFSEMNLQYRLHAPEMAREETGNERVQFDSWVCRYAAEIAMTHLFRDVETMLYPWSQEYGLQEYLDLLDTYSDHRSLPQEVRSRLYEGVSDVIARHGGRVVKEYVAVLFLARKDSH